jgi:putative tryptophan/tyrosine transport system substrate-binding protein
MKRRELIAGLASAAAWPVVARAQQPTVAVIGYLGAQSAELDYKLVTIPFLGGLKETGYVVGQNVEVEYRYAENQPDRLPALAADLVRRRVAVIVASGTSATLAAKAASATIPIVFATGADPVALGLVASLNRPGANLTFIERAGAETIAIASRVDTQRCRVWRSRRSGLSGYPIHRHRPTGGGAQAGPATRCCECENR